MRDAGLDGLESARLKLRRFTLDDEALLYRLNGDPAVMRYLGGPLTAEASRANLQGRILGYYEAHPGLGVWATCERAGGRCIGFHLLNQVMGEEMIQVGYRLFEADWGKGYATEMTIALLRYGFSVLHIPRLTANADLRNHDSQKVLLKAGLHRNGERVLRHPMYAAYGASGPVAYYERDAAGWLAEFGDC